MGHICGTMWASSPTVCHAGRGKILIVWWLSRSNVGCWFGPTGSLTPTGMGESNVDPYTVGESSVGTMDRLRCQSGYMLVMVMVFMALVTIVVISMLDTSVMEALISRNIRDGEQAFQLAEGAVFLGVEQSYQVLSQNYRTVEILPAVLELAETNFTDSVDGKTVEMQVSNPRLIEQRSDYCIYEIRGQGTCPPAQYRLKVQVRFDYLEYHSLHYGTDGSVSMAFSHRDFLDRGKIIRMEKELQP